MHQVSGHSSLLCLDETTICKPVVSREQAFYETLPQALKLFVPMYYGVIKVHLIQNGDYIILGATSPANYEPKTSTSVKRSLRLKRTGSIEFDELSGDVMFDLSGVSTALNPWVLKCHKDYITSLIPRMHELSEPLKFIVLENLTWRFRLPCILDLKMGTRQYSDNDSPAKIESKMVKMMASTTAKLGVRIAGMQVYQATSGRFLCRNKLYGRKLNVDGFRDALRSFLHDGTRLRKDALPPLIRRLEELRSVLAQFNSLRLYTTSLLLIYEGCHAVKLRLAEEEPLTDVRIIDFAHSTHATMEDKVLYSGPDSGFLLGLNNMIQLFKSILEESLQ